MNENRKKQKEKSLNPINYGIYRAVHGRAACEAVEIFRAGSAAGAWRSLSVF
jgi:hypothetical protein